jgi:endonuclease I
MKHFLLTAIAFLFLSSLFAQIPTDYYNDAEGKTGDALKSALHNIIDGHNAGSYDLLWTILPESDEDPDNSSNFILIYTGRSIPKTSSYPAYNREHVWAKSHGDFGTSAPAGTDAHHLRPSDVDVNSARGNLDFDNGGTLVSGTTGCYSDGDSFEPRDAVKGDVARMMFYMATRYEGDVSGEPDLELVDYITGSTSSPIFGKLSTLLQWHIDDPVDDIERHRNEVVYSYQNNANPFIDHPEYVCQIWGGDCSTVPSISDITITPANPKSTETVSISATITDDGTIANAKLYWGISSGSLTNTIIMSVSSGDTYTTNSDIPVQADGVTVYYKIEATDDEAEVSTSAEKSYTIEDNPSTNIFYEYFETSTPEAPIDINSWILHEEAGAKTWEGREFESNKYAQMSAYSTGETSNIAWLITPEIDLTSIISATFSFISKDAYNNGEPVEVFISTNYSGTGDPSSATWSELSATFATGSSSGYADNFTESGEININSYCGNTVFIGYKYTGGDPSLTTTMQIDNVLITGVVGTNSKPQITNVDYSPTDPESSENVTVSASISDSDGTISSAKIKWGTSTGNYSNELTMTASKGNYSGSIPAQVDGTEVYFVVYALDNDEGSAQSLEEIYTVSDPNVLPQITNVVHAPSSPIETEDVTVSATITDDGTISSAKIKWGITVGNYTNEVTMTNSGSTYSGVIPKQTAGTIVYYIIEVIDNLSESNTSVEKSVSFTSVSNELPQISNISYSPADPESSENVTVSATISDADGTISSAKVKWGTVIGSYPNEVTMTASKGNYSGFIPAQADGTNVYFVVYTIDNEGGSAESIEESYMVNDPNVLPQVTNVDYSPTNPESSENVSVSATISDADGTITSVKIKWGTSTGSYLNEVTMTASKGNYSGSIPAQADGTEVYFIVYAIDNEGGSTQSIEESYVVTDPNVLPQITNIDFQPTDPESSENVSVSATISDADGTIASAKIKWGTSTGNYSNEVTMTASKGNYSGSIPAQADGTNVYFIVYTIDNEGGSAQSSEENYTVNDPYALPQITNIMHTPTDPTDQEDVTVSATITDDGSIQSAKLSWGTASGNLTNILNMSNSGDVFSVVIPSQSGGLTVYYSIRATDNNSEPSTSAEMSYTVSTSIGIDKINAENLIVYPNPTSDKVFVELNTDLIIKSITVYNLIGEKITEVKDINANKYTLDLGRFLKGYYVVQINGSNFSTARKIMLK